MKQMKKTIAGLILTASMASGLAESAETKVPHREMVPHRELSQDSKSAVEIQTMGFLVATQRDLVPAGTLRPWIRLTRSLAGYEVQGEIQDMGLLIATQRGTVPVGFFRPWIQLVRSLAGY